MIRGAREPRFDCKLNWTELNQTELNWKEMKQTKFNQNSESLLIYSYMQIW
jgi:hypothetical protein